MISWLRTLDKIWTYSATDLVHDNLLEGIDVSTRQFVYRLYRTGIHFALLIPYLFGWRPQQLP